MALISSIAMAADGPPIPVESAMTGTPLYLPRIESVSYTHLDVYKRQSEDRSADYWGIIYE